MVIPDGVTGIGENAFDGCTSLTSITIPGSVTDIWHEALGLTNIGYRGSREQWERLKENAYGNTLVIPGNAAIQYNTAQPNQPKFTDLEPNAFYLDAVDWAVTKNITTGTTATTFDPNGTCNRGQIVTFPYRAYA